MSVADLIGAQSTDVVTIVEIYMPARGAVTSELYWYIADQPYRTRSTDTPADMSFTPCLASVPRYSVSLSEPGAPRASVSFGSIELSTPFVSHIFTISAAVNFDLDNDVRSNVWPGAQVTVKQTGPRKKYAYSEAVTIFSGVVESIGSDDSDVTQINVTSAGNQGLDHTLTGPRVYGRVLNFTPRLDDFATLEYGVNNDDAIEAINAVYDSAVALATPADYSPVLASGQLTLTSQPDFLTVDVDGGKLDGTWAESTQDIVELMLDQAGSTLTLSSDWDILTDRIGYALQTDEIKTIPEILDELARSHLAFWWVDDSGELTFRDWVNSDSEAAYYDQNQVFSYSWSHLDRSYTPGTFSSFYGRNWSPGSPVAAGAATAQAEFAGREYLTGLGGVTGGTNGSNEVQAPPNFTLFAASVTNRRWFQLFPNLSRLYSVTVPLDSPRQLADQIGFWTTEGDKSGFCMGREITLDGAGSPIQTLTILVAP